MRGGLSFTLPSATAPIVHSAEAYVRPSANPTCPASVTGAQLSWPYWLSRNPPLELGTITVGAPTQGDSAPQCVNDPSIPGSCPGLYYTTPS